jgi:hypothetical protein
MAKSTPSFSDLYGSKKYFSAEDTDEEGFVGTVETVEFHDMRDGGTKAVVLLEGHDKGIVLNKTRARVLATISGSKEWEDWEGIRVKVMAGTTDFAGKEVSCIVFKAPPKSAKKAEKKPPKGSDDLNDEIPEAFA